MIFLSGSLMMAAGCVSRPVRPYHVFKGNVGAWSGQALIVNKSDKSEHTVDLQIVAERNRNVRIDVTASFGIYVASLVVHRQKFQLLLAREHKFYFGRATNKVLKPILGLAMNPAILQNLLFDTDPEASEFSCTKDGRGLLKKCVSQADKLTIAWMKRNDQSRTIDFNSPEANLKLYLGSVQTNVHIDSKTFHLTAPHGFHVYRLN